MDNHEAIASLKTLCHTCKLFPRCAYEKPECFQAIEMAISALQAQDSETRRICDTCKHDPPSKKWPCMDCDMRDPADRWEPKDVPDINDGDIVSRQVAIDALMDEFKRVPTTAIRAKNRIDRLPSAQPERKTGRWLIRNGISDAQCSECKMYFSDVYDVENSDAFCRHCGAKMEGLKVVKRG